MAIEMILSQRPSLKVLKARSLTTDTVGISYMNMLAQVTNLEKLELHFARLRVDELAKPKPGHFPHRGNTSVTSLKIILNSAGKQ